MSGSLTLSVSNPDDDREPFLRLAARAALVDGQAPFNDQALVDASTGARSLLLAERGGGVVGAAVVGRGELEFVIDPEWRGEGLGRELAAVLLANHAEGRLLAWAHGDHPASRRLAARFGFEPVRTLLQLRRALGEAPDAAGAPDGGSAPDAAGAPDAGSAPDGAGAPDDAGTPGASDAVTLPAGYTLATFRGGRDIDDWVALNAAVFADHPEQGSLTADDVRFRQSEAWFDPDDFLLLRDAEGRLAGYNWLKIEPGDPVGEIYVIGIAEAHAGHGLGRALMQAGLARLRERGCREAALYVDGENTRAVALYRSLGFDDHTIDVQYAPRSRPVRR